MTIGERLRERRLEKGLSLRELSAQLGITAQTLQRYETGKILNIGPDMVNKLASALGTSGSWLLGELEHSPASGDTVYLSKTERNLLQILRNLPSDQKKIVMELIFSMNDSNIRQNEIQMRLDFAEDFISATEYESDYRSERDDQFRSD